MSTTMRAPALGHIGERSMDRSRQMQKRALAIVQSNSSVVVGKSLPAATRGSKTSFRNEGIELDSSLPAADTHGFTGEETEKFLHIIKRCARIQRHYELFLLMQGELQYFIPHQILIAAWGDFRRRGLKVDVISGLPGVRAEQFANCSGRHPDHGMTGLLKRMHGIWRDGGRQARVLNKPAAALEAPGVCRC